MSARTRRWLLHELQTETPAATPSGVMVTLAASMGSDIAEQSEATGIPVEDLRAAVLETYDLEPWATDALGAWLVCAVWRHGYRCGCDEEETGSLWSIEAMAAQCSPPSGWLADLKDCRDGVSYSRATGEDGKRRRRLTVEEAAHIVELYGRGATMAELAGRFAVNVSTIHRCIRGKTRAAKAAESEKEGQHGHAGDIPPPL